MSVTKITDANALYEIARLYTSAFPTYNSEMKRVLQIEKIVEYSDNADTLQKETPAQIIKQAKDAIEAHRKNLQNPHNETVESIGTLTGDYFKSLVVNKMPAGVLPISAFGYDYKSWADKSIAGWFTVVGENLVVGPDVTVMMNGSEFPIPAGTYDLREVHATWRTVPIFIYFRQVEGVPVLDLLAMNQKDTRTLMLGGVIRAGNTTPEMQRTIKVGSYRLSSTPVGQATAVGLNAFNSTYGIHRGWVPSTNVLQPDIPPKVEIKLLDYDRGNGANGYITSSQGGELLLQADVGVDPNIYFTLDGESVTVTATVEVLSGAAPIVTKVSNTQFRVRCATYSNSRITFTATIPSGDTATYTLRTEHRTNLSIRYNTSDFTIGSYGGLTKLTAMVNVRRWFNTVLTGDGVVTSVTSGAITGGSYTLRRVDNTTFDVIGSVDAMRLVTVTATDKYGRTATLQLYVEVRTAYPPTISLAGSFFREEGNKYNTGRNYDGLGTLTSSNLGISTQAWTACGRGPSYVKTATRVKVERGSTLSKIHSSGRIEITNNIGIRKLDDDHYSIYLAYSPCSYSSYGNTGGHSGYFYLRATNTIGETLDSRTHAYCSSRREQGCHSCFSYDSIITMADGTEKKIGDILVGDMILTAVGPRRVFFVDKPLLGDRPFYSFNGKCKTSGEHSIWSRDENQNQFWSTRDMKQWKLESSEGAGPNFGGRLPYDYSNVQGPRDFATLGGWSTESWQLEEASPDLQLYNLWVEDGGSYFVDGYLVSSMASVHDKVDWEEFTWDGKVVIDYKKR